MEELSFDRTYRPSNLSQYVGNARIKEMLKSVLARDPKPSFILITGQSGLGKTTLARIIGKELRCTDRDVVNGACNTCDSCKAFNEYIKTGKTDEIPLVTELDLGRSSQIEGIRNQLDMLELQTLNGVRRIVIWDEVQEMRRGGQDALLKTLEEPGTLVTHIMCTTNPESLQNTIRGRANPDITLVKPRNEELVQYLASISKTEGIKFDKQGLEIIAARADNIPREAVKLLETVSRQRDSLEHDKVIDVLDTDNITDDLIFKFYNAMLNQESKTRYLTILNDIKQKEDLGTFVNKLITFTKRGLYIHNSIDIKGLTKQEVAKYNALFNKFTIAEISTLLGTLRKLKDGDIETNLFLLGYTSLDSRNVNLSEEERISDMLIVEEDDELKKEGVVRDEQIKERKEENLRQGLENLETMSKGMDEEDLLAKLNM